jgi:phage baseplate assembly protein gpV
MFNGNYRGIVKTHGDNGRCKVFVPSIMPVEFEDKPNDLPWCEPAQPLFASTENGGMFQYPSINSTVWVFFEDGDINLPVMFAVSLGDKFFDGSNNKKFLLKTDKFTMEIDDASDLTTITINTVNVNANMNVVGNVTVDGTLDVTGDVTTDSNLMVKGGATVGGGVVAGGGISAGGDITSPTVSMNSHKHLEQGDGKPTTPPII